MNRPLLRSIISYDPINGIFAWVSSRAGTPVGRQPGNISSSGYRRIQINRQMYQAHNLIWVYMTGKFPPKGMEIDHINGIRSDNRWINLRLATRSQNLANKSKKKWHARISKSGKIISLGYFETEELAHNAYCIGSTIYHGQFARAK